MIFKVKLILPLMLVNMFYLRKNKPRSNIYIVFSVELCVLIIENIDFQSLRSAIFQRTYGGYLLERDLRRQEKEKAKKQELDSAAPKKRGRKRDAKHLESTSSSSSSNPASRNDSNSSLSYPVAGMNDRNLLSVSRKPSKKINYEALEVVYRTFANLLLFFVCNDDMLNVYCRKKPAIHCPLLILK